MSIAAVAGMGIAAASATAAPSWRRAVALVVVTVAVWAPALGGAFHFDDLPNVVLEPATGGGAALAERLANGFRPLLRLSYALDHALWGFDAAGFLATNLALHVATVLLVWRLAASRLGEGAGALAAALVFALQPAHGAVVAWTSGRSTGLATLLVVAALLAHERAVARGGGARHGLVIGLMALATLAKEVALALPALVMLWEATRMPALDARRILARAAPTAVAAALMLAIVLAASPRLRTLLAFSFELADPFAALSVHLAAVPVSLGLWFRPWALSVEHAAPAGVWASAAGGAVLAAAVLLAAALRRRAPLVALGLLWPLLVLLPSHSVIARLDPVVEKPLYGAWIGPSLGIGAGIAVVLATRARGAIVAVIVLAVGCAGAARWRAVRWAEPAALWQEATRRAPASPRAWLNSAVAELDAGRLATAADALAAARRLDPDNPRLVAVEFALDATRLAQPKETP